MVEDGKTVKVHYTLTVDGEEIDSSMKREPLEFTAGRQEMIPGFEKALMGMAEGEKKTFEVSAEEGYGAFDPKGILEVNKDRLPSEISAEPGMTLYATGENGQSFAVRVVDVKEEMVVIDFNHPLAGKTLNFDVEVVEVR